MSARSRAAAALAGAAVVAVLLWTLRALGPSDDAPPTPQALKEPGVHPASLPEVALARSSALGEAWLDVTVEGLEVWTRAGSMRAFASTAHAAPNEWAAPDEAASFVEGTGRIRVAASTWTWLRVQPDGPPAPVALARVEPFVGTRALRLFLGERAALHVLVLDADGSTPAAEVEVLAEQLTTDRGPACVARARTDSFGHARLVDLPDGLTTVRTAGTTAADTEPLVCKLSVFGRCGASDQIVTLLLPRPRQHLTLAVTVPHFPRDLPLPPRLFLREPTEGRVVPILAVLQSGANRIELTVEPGDYEVDALPYGFFAANVVEGTLRVGAASVGSAGGSTDGPAAHVVLADHRARTSLQLDGIDAMELPLRVTLRDPALPVVPAEDLMVYGSMRWHRTTCEVPSVLAPMQLVVFTRQRALTSREAVRIEGGARRVDLLPASRVEITWVTEQRPARPLVVVRNVGPTLLVPLRLDVLSGPQQSGVVYRAQVVVPHGAAVLECADGDGQLLWRREIALATSAVHVEV